jgi:WD40 repeat protein
MTAVPADPWTVAIHGATDEVLGAGVVVDHRLVLTCAHVVMVAGQLRGELWVTFPKAPGTTPKDRRQIRHCVHNGQIDRQIDLVLLELADPVPASVTPARLRCPEPGALTGRAWWSFGFPQGQAPGSAVSGEVGEALSYGQVYLARQSKHRLAKGFSGSPLWAPDYQAVVGIVVSAGQGDDSAGDGHALTLSYANHLLPEMKLSTLDSWRAESADESALAAWGWELSRDDEAGRHWLPRARGVAVESERGSWFRGRAAALRYIVDWLDRPAAAGHPLVVTGSPGVGKSAVLGRVVTTADPEIRASLPPDDDAVRATEGSIACAVHAKGKSAIEVATEIARAASTALPAVPADLSPALRQRLGHRPGRFNLVIDALDEAANAEQARQIVHEVIRPLARDFVDVGVQVAVGTRRADDQGSLLAELGTDADLVDLDSPEFFAEPDLAGYALATLQLLGAERPGNPYADPAVAQPMARRIAAKAEGNFLVAGLIARAHGLHDRQSTDPGRITAVTVADALDAYVAGLPAAGDTPAWLALTVLGYAESPGLPIELWRGGVEALGGVVTEDELAAFARTSAANFLVETGTAAVPVYRLFHQALNEALLGRRASGAEDERRLTRAWLADGRTRGWARAPEYLLRSLPQHAARVRLVDELLADDDYLLHAHLRRLLPAAESARTGEGRTRARLLQRTPLAMSANPGDRAAMFSVVDKMDSLGTGLDPGLDAPYRARWAHTPARLERAVLDGHSDAVYDVCAVPVDGRTLLASAGEDGTVRLWDPLTGQTEQVLDCHADCIHGVHAVRARDRVLIATASHDTTIGLWEPRSGRRVHHLRGHDDWVRNLCAVPMPDGGELLASASDDRTVRLWDPDAGSLVHKLTGHSGWVTAVCHIPEGPHGMLASTGFDGTIRLWDPLTGAPRMAFRAHLGWATTLTAVRTAERTLLASAGYDGAVRAWDPADGTLVWQHDSQAGPLTDLCTIAAEGEQLLAATAEDGAVRLWCATTGEPWRELRGHASWTRANCQLPVGDRRMLATAGDDGTVRLWDLATGRLESGRDEAWLGAVTTVCGFSVAGRPLVVTGGADGVIRVRDALTGAEEGDPQSSGSPVNELCAIVDEEGVLVATAGADSEVQLWEVDEQEPVKRLQEHHGPVNAVCRLQIGGRPVVASGSDDEMVRLWNPHRAREARTLVGHRDWVTALAAVTSNDRQLLASADKSGTVRLWDPEAEKNGQLCWEQPGHADAVNALCAVRRGGREVLVSAGADRVIQLWDPSTGRRLAGLTGHTAPVTGVCPLSTGGRDLLISTSHDRTVRIWDPVTGRTVRVIPVHDKALACDYVAGTLVIGLDHGLLALTI